MSQTATFPQILTLKEVATYLRLPAAAVERHAGLGEIPGRRIEGAWRFLRSALEDWLRTPDPSSVLLSQAGALADDEARRGRPEVCADQLADEHPAQPVVRPFPSGRCYLDNLDDVAEVLAWAEAPSM